MNLHIPLEASTYYHIYNRGINSEDLFKQEQNYSFFLLKYALYLSPVVNTFAYCLLKNHFHLLIRVKSEQELNLFYNQNQTGNKLLEKKGLHSPDFIVSKQFAKLFSSYSQAINKAVGRTGSLFETPFKRIEVGDNNYFTHMIWYIHNNPVKHGFVSNLSDYAHSSFHSHLLTKPTKLAREEVLEWFGGSNQYLKFHKTDLDDDSYKKYIIEF